MERGEGRGGTTIALVALYSSRVQPCFIKWSLSEIGRITAGADPLGFTLGNPLGDVLRGFLGAIFYDWYLTSLLLSPLIPSSLLYFPVIS